MTTRSAFLVAAVFVIGCSAEQRAQKVLDKYENVFVECQKITEEVGAEPGTHYCSKVGSMALEGSLDNTGIDKSTRNRMIAEWTSSNPLGKFYADEAARADIPDM